MTVNRILAAAGVAAIITIFAPGAFAQEAVSMPAPAPATEKCYGVAKAGPQEAIELPAGVCEKLANGSLIAPPAPPAPEAPPAPPAETK